MPTTASVAISLYNLLPNFFILGAAKAGSTSLFSYMGQHPDICFSAYKEPHFFDNPTHYAQGLVSYAQNYFAGAAAYSWRGDASPNYFTEHAQVIPSLQSSYGDRPLKFIIIFREPVARAWSHYSHRYKETVETRDFAQAIADEQRRGARGLEWDNYIDDGRYATHLRAWLQHYDRSQFHFVLTDDLAADAEAATRAIFRFLGIAPDVPLSTDQRLNSSTRRPNPGARLRRYLPPQFYALARALMPNYYARRQLRERIMRQIARFIPVAPPPLPARMPPDLAVQLHAIYRPEIEDLATLIDRDLSHWLRNPPTD
jgi:hypothetical protein